MAKGPARRNRIRFRLTVAGWLFLAVSTLLGVAAIKSQVAMLFILFGCMLGAIQFSALVGRAMLKSLRLRREVPGRAWQNRTVHLGYYLRNLRGHGACVGLSVREEAPGGIESVDGYCLHVPAGSVFRAGGRLVARHRGRIHLREIQVSTIFPFGLVAASCRIPQEETVVIWPAKGRLKVQMLRRGAVETSSAAPSPATGGQDEFFGLRDYRPGDNPRWINWRRTAGRPTAVLREMSRPLPEVLWVLVDTYWKDPSQNDHKEREKLLRLAATLVDHASARGYQVGMALAYQDAVRVLPPGAGRGSWCLLLDALADVDANTTRPLDQVVGQLRRAQLAAAQVVVITPGVSGAAAEALGSLRAVCRSLTVIQRHQVDSIFEDDPLLAQEEQEAAPCP